MTNTADAKAGLRADSNPAHGTDWGEECGHSGALRRGLDGGAAQLMFLMLWNCASLYRWFTVEGLGW